jgi:hypothetical protein
VSGEDGDKQAKDQHNGKREEDDDSDKAKDEGKAEKKDS